jgi:hypothetical protein
MKKNRFLLFAVAALLSFNSCKKESADPGDANTNTPITFLKVGNKWVYNITSGFTTYTTTTNEVTGVNNGIYTISTKFDDTPGDRVYLYGENGYLNWYDEGQAKGANQQILKYNNAQVGDTWTRITPTETYHHECVSINESVTVPAGTFVCKKIHTTFENAFNDQDTYWSDEFGQIKIDNLVLSTELASKNF